VTTYEDPEQRKERERQEREQRKERERQQREQGQTSGAQTGSQPPPDAATETTDTEE
jgi:hypothetical protein